MKKKILLTIYIITSITLGVITFYFSKLFSHRLPEVFQETVYPTDLTNMCGGRFICNGTRSIGCQGSSNVKVKGVLNGNSYQGGPCCIQCSNDGLTCLEIADCAGSCTGWGGCTVSNKHDCACGGISCTIIDHK